MDAVRCMHWCWLLNSAIEVGLLIEDQPTPCMTWRTVFNLKTPWCLEEGSKTPSQCKEERHWGWGCLGEVRSGGDGEVVRGGGEVGSKLYVAH